MIKLLLVGKLPPPIGGVTIHLQRLYSKLLEEDGIAPTIFTEEVSFNNFKKLFAIDVIHIHLNNQYNRLVFIIISSLLRKKSIITFHRDYDRNTGLKKKLDELAVCLVDLPLMLNEESKVKAKQLNNKTNLISSFLKPVDEEPLSPEIQRIVKSAKKFNTCFATNAHHYRMDKNQKEIYGIIELVKLFKTIPKVSLIVSDPSGEYKNRIDEKDFNNPDNIFFISSPHSFYNILKDVDGFIRNTTTDGDSLSIHEALDLDK